MINRQLIGSNPGSSVAQSRSSSIDHADRRTLLARIFIAGALIVALIAALALFERRPPPAIPESVTSPAAPQPPAGSLNQASGAIAPPAAEPAAKPEAPAEPEGTGAPKVAQESAGAPKAAPEGVGAPRVAPEGVGAPKVAPLLPGERAGSARSAQSVAEDTRPRLIVGRDSEQSGVTKPPPAAVPAKPAPAEAPPAAKPRGGGFLVQVGVFSSLANAEDLRRKLVEAGIPAQIEARVQVGPFANRAEAASAQSKLKSLGMEAGILLPPRR